MTTKVCTRCRSEKSVEEFKAVTTNKSGLHSWCSSCRKVHARAAHRKHYLKKKAELAVIHKEYYEANKEKLNKRCKQRKLQAYWRDLTPEEAQKKYNELLLKQDGKCAICDTHQSELEVGLAVDHNHDTGKVRGLLCRKCNTAIGLLKDDVKLVVKALEYLRSNS